MTSPAGFFPMRPRSVVAAMSWVAATLCAHAAWGATCAPAWSEGLSYSAGQLASYQGSNYKSLVTHTAYAGTNWNPATTASLWSWAEPCATGSPPQPAPPPTGAACFYADIEFQGAFFCSNEATADVPGDWNDRISSVRVASGYRVELREHIGQQGAGLALTADERNLVNRGFNDATSSYRVGKATAPSSSRTLAFLKGISGRQVVSGQHNDEKQPTPDAYTNRVRDITGLYPGLWSGDFLFHGNSSMRWELVREAEEQWNAGALVNLMWHACPPTRDDGCGWDGGVVSALSDDQWRDLVTDGGYLNQRWKARMDNIAPYLQYLRDRGVEVLWRPLHEINHSVFWWSGRPGPGGSARLYQITHDYLVKEKGLTNLVWVWNVQDFSNKDTHYAAFNPGSSYWDVATLDVYEDGFYNSRYYDALLAQAGDKPIGFGESFKVPPPSVLERFSRISFFMVWAYGLERDNSHDEIRNTYYHPRVLTRDEIRR